MNKEFIQKHKGKLIIAGIVVVLFVGTFLLFNGSISGELLCEERENKCCLKGTDECNVLYVSCSFDSAPVYKGCEFYPINCVPDIDCEELSSETKKIREDLYINSEDPKYCSEIIKCFYDEKKGCVNTVHTSNKTASDNCFCKENVCESS
ncbi:hypothetical protein KKG83_05235 [Candidatus Micrarchaeota archaeon]|nr:hypothetical protein [Candidatus Micrarchaeota archaeon]